MKSSINRLAIRFLAFFLTSLTLQAFAQPVDLVAELRPLSTPARGASKSPRRFDVHTPALSAAEIAVDLPTGKRIIFTRTKPSGTHSPAGSWIGTVAGEPATVAYLAVHKGVLSGTVFDNGTPYDLRKAEGAAYTFEESPHKDDANCCGGGDAVPAPEALNQPDVSRAPAAEAISPADAGIPHMDVMFVYTSAARTAAGGASAIEALAANCISSANLTLANSSANLRLRSAGTYFVDYNESLYTWDDILLDIYSKIDGSIDDVHAERDRRKADAVFMLVKKTGQCGIGSLGYPNTHPGLMFAIGDVDCVLGQYTFIHELGHNLGCDHATINLGTFSTTRTNYGFVTADKKYRTVMATFENAGSSVRIPMFSGPANTYQGYTMGTAARENATGQINYVVSREMGAFSGSPPGFYDGAPEGFPQELQTARDMSLAITLSGMDPELRATTFAVVSGPGHGSLAGTAPDLVYSPAPGFVGTDTISFVVNDGVQDSPVVSVSIAVLAPNTPPAVNAGPDQSVRLVSIPLTPGWAYAPWTGDADCGVSPGASYTVAHCFGDTNGGAVTVNGITFTESLATSGSGWSVGGTVANTSDPDFNITGQSAKFAQKFIYNANPRTVTFSGLSAGATYQADFYSVAFGTNPRILSFASAGAGSSTIDQTTYGNNNGIRIRCSYTATGSSQLVTITPQDPVRTFHLCAMANRTVPTKSVTVNLAATVSDPEQSPTVIWTKFSGPGGVVFGSANAVNTTATFTVPGTYTLRLTASDSYVQSTDDVVIVVGDPSPYDLWMGNSGGALTADANNDGVSNGIAWLLGASDSLSDAVALLPALDLAPDPDYAIYSYRRRDSANSNATVKVQYSGDLYTWTDAVSDGTNVIITVSDDFYGAGIDKVEVKFKKALATGGKFFSRVRLQLTP